jgi:5-methylcytosine-specific restriction endonuclease McrA
MSTVRTRPTVDYDSGLKHCSECDKWLPFADFSPSKHKNGGCGMKSYCRQCGYKKYPYKPRENPKLQPKPHIFDIQTRVELRPCSACKQWLPLTDYFVCGGHLQNICKTDSRRDSRERARRNIANHVEAAKRWQAANPEKAKANRLKANRTYSKAHPDKMADKQHRRRAILAAAPQVERVDRKVIIKRDKQTCYMCRRKLTLRDVTLDHVIPLSRGGSHIASNLRVACGHCNFAKHNRLLAELASVPAVQIGLL